jgi:hypothetical protein
VSVTVGEFSSSNQEKKRVNRMQKVTRRLFMSLLIFLLVACSSQSEEKSSLDRASFNNSGEIAISEEAADTSSDSNEISNENTKVNRKVIYKATLRMRVKNYQNAHRNLEDKAKQYRGFLIGSNSHQNGEEQMSGSITLRVPEEHFQAFLNDAEGEAEEILERNVSGSDVTEEYVDLESRLRSKRVVEERLLEFMKNANKTEDLLKISNDLADVQEEIERVVGRMKFLENQSALSTITINLFENNVIIPNIEKKELNTWDKTKKQFVSSTNFLLGALSGIFIFLFGNLPIFIILAGIAITPYVWLLKKRKVQVKVRTKSESEKE